MSSGDVVADRLDELVRIMAIQLRAAASSQSEAILLLHRAGFGRARIAELLGTTAGTVNQEIVRASKKAPKSNDMNEAAPET